MQSGAALQLDLANASGEQITGVAAVLNGTGPTGNGALENLSGNAVWQGTNLKTGQNTLIPAIKAAPAPWMASCSPLTPPV